MTQNKSTTAAEWDKAMAQIAQMLTENGYNAPAVINRWVDYIRRHMADGQPLDLKESIRQALEADE